MSNPEMRMNRRRLLEYGGVAAGAVVTGGGLAWASQTRASGARAAAAQATSAVDWQAVARAVGGPGEMKDNGVFLVELSRTDINATGFGVKLQPDLAMDGEAAFKQMTGGTMVMGELALLQKEVIPVWRGLLANGFTVSGIHNHLIEASPVIMFLHYSGMGDAMGLARRLRAALGGSKTPVTTSATKKAPAIDIKSIQQVFGMPGELGDEVFYLEVPRAEQIRMNGMVIPPAMGVESYFYFQSAGNGKAASQAEFALLASEVDAVNRVMMEHGVNVTALHNHMTTIQPMLFWMHAWMTGDAATIARTWQAALSHTNFKK